MEKETKVIKHKVKVFNYREKLLCYTLEGLFHKLSSGK
jgi:hypothetical protein